MSADTQPKQTPSASRHDAQEENVLGGEIYHFTCCHQCALSTLEAWERRRKAASWPVLSASPLSSQTCQQHRSAQTGHPLAIVHLALAGFTLGGPTCTGTAPVACTERSPQPPVAAKQLSPAPTPSGWPGQADNVTSFVPRRFKLRSSRPVTMPLTGPPDSCQVAAPAMATPQRRSGLVVSFNGFRES